MKYFFFIILYSFSFFSQAQEKTIQRADSYFSQSDYVNALKWYQKALQKSADEIPVKLKVAYCYLKLSRFEQAESAYSEIFDEEIKDPETIFQFATVLHANGKYEKATNYYNKFAGILPEDPRGIRLAGLLEKIEPFLQPDPDYQINSAPFNSSAIERNPIFFQNGIVYIHTDETENAVDVFTSSRIYSISIFKNGKSGTPKLLLGEELNTKFGEGPATFNLAQNEMFFTRTIVSSDDKKFRQEIWRAQFSIANEMWADLEPIHINSNSISIMHPSLSQDGKRLFFVSDMPGGFGQYDLYVSYRKGKQWSPPENLGSRINTAENECFPAIASNGTLYFASDGYAGLGLLDIYEAKFIEGRWDEVSNLGSPVNSNANDYGYIIDEAGGWGFFTSNRKDSKGLDDIYSFVKANASIRGNVIEPRTGNVVPGAKLTLYDGDNRIAHTVSDSSGSFVLMLDAITKSKLVVEYPGFEKGEVAISSNDRVLDFYVNMPLGKPNNINIEISVNNKEGHAIENAQVVLVERITSSELFESTDKSGKCNFALEWNKNYYITVSKNIDQTNEGFTKVESSISTEDINLPALIYIDFELQYFKENQIIEIPDIHYELGKWAILPAATAELKKLVKILIDNPFVEIELRSHTDCRGNAQFNLNLSYKRAASVMEFLSKNGIDRERLLSKGYGEELPKIPCQPCETCSEEVHVQNRRTEFRILKFN